MSQFVEVVRKEFPDILLQVDANSAYTLTMSGRSERWTNSVCC